VHFMDLLVGAGLVAAGALVGTAARVFVSERVAVHVGDVFPWGILAVNVSGCFLAGLALAHARQSGLAVGSQPWLLASTGFLGSYTTVSSFALQTLTLLRSERPLGALAYVAASVGLCVLAVAAGYRLVGAAA
jgi:fluoride exporter